MPNIVSQSVSSAGIYVRASDGAEINVTSARVKEQHDSLAGSNEAIQVQTVERWLAALIADALGERNISPDQIEVHYDPETGSPTEFTVYG